MASQPLSPMSRARAVHDEWIQATDSLRRIGHEFNQIIIDSVNESRVHRSRAIELEDRHRDLVTENNTFRIHNEELKRLLELSQPDAGSAIESSGSAYRKLRHVRRIMRDLLEDLTTEFGDSPNEGASLLLHSEPRERAQVRELGAPASPSSRSRRNDMSSNSPSSGNTVRPRSSGKARSSPAKATIMPEPSSASTSHPRASKTGVSGVVSNPGNQQATSSETSSSGSDPSVDVSVHVAGHSSVGDDDLWRLSSSRSPRSAEVVCLVEMQLLRERLELDEDTIYSLESLSQMDEHCFHLQIIDDMAFVHDPFSMDGPGESLLMDWGTLSANEKVREYIVRTRPKDRVLHTFTYPVKRGVWYYIGAHAWNMKDLFQVWPTLGDKAKEVVTAKLRRRCNRRHSQQDIAEMIQDGRLQQFCIEVNSRSLETLSQEFAKNRLGFEGGNLAK